MIIFETLTSKHHTWAFPSCSSISLFPLTTLNGSNIQVLPKTQVAMPGFNKVSSCSDVTQETRKRHELYSNSLCVLLSMNELMPRRYITNSLIYRPGGCRSKGTNGVIIIMIITYGDSWSLSIYTTVNVLSHAEHIAETKLTNLIHIPWKTTMNEVTKQALCFQPPAKATFTLQVP